MHRKNEHINRRRFLAGIGGMLAAVGMGRLPEFGREADAVPAVVTTEPDWSFMFEDVGRAIVAGVEDGMTRTVSDSAYATVTLGSGGRLVNARLHNTTVFVPADADDVVIARNVLTFDGPALGITIA